MAGIDTHYMYGRNKKCFEMMKNEGVGMQLHLTAKCEQKCKHCYMFEDKSYKNQIENEMSTEIVEKLIDEYVEFMDELNCTASLAITGGDPILSDSFWPLLEYIQKKYNEKLSIVIMGNPYHIHQAEAERLRELGVHSYQISLDGLREVHDYYRKEGSFDESIRALKELHRVGIETVVSFTVSKTNYRDYIPLFRFLENKDYVDNIGFDRMTPVGNATYMSDSCFTAEEYRNFLFNVFKEEIMNPGKKWTTRKEKMWRLLFYQLGLSNPLTEEKRICTGCMAGISSISVLADGTIMSCRRIEIEGGRYPEKPLKELYLQNSTIKKMALISNYEGCKDCELLSYCRGCAASRYATNGKLFGKEVLCWRD